MNLLENRWQYSMLINHFKETWHLSLKTPHRAQLSYWCFMLLIYNLKCFMLLIIFMLHAINDFGMFHAIDDLVCWYVL